MKKVLLGSMVAFSVLASSASFADDNCFIQVTVDSKAPTLAQFNYLMNNEIAGSLDDGQLIQPGHSTGQRVACGQKYSIYATPVSKVDQESSSKGVPSLPSNRAASAPLGRCEYKGNDITMGNDTGISVVYPTDFHC